MVPRVGTAARIAAVADLGLRRSRLLDAETLYTQSRNNLTSAYAAYHTSLAKYMRVTGR